jgi:hypothetical protein
MKVKLFRKKFTLPGNLSFFLKYYLNINTYHIKKKKNHTVCGNCYSDKKEFYITKTIPDFKISLLSKNLAEKFYIRAIGKCLKCNLIQDYYRFNKNDLNKYLEEIKSKDKTIGEEVWKSYPVPTHYKNFLFLRHFKNRFQEWKKSNIFKKSKIDNILLLRPTMGFLVNFCKEMFPKANIEYLDISEISQKSILDEYPNVKNLEGNIHGIFKGEFLKKENNYDLIITNHLLIHCLNIDETLNQLKYILNKNGLIIFTDEINVKYHNPFHINFWGEQMFVDILKKRFTQIKILRNCGFPTYSTHPFTKHKDNPDFFVYKN